MGRRDLVCLNKKSLVFISAIALASGSSSAQLPYPESFSLEDVVALPVSAPPVASPSGDRLAWVVEERGRRNVWVAAPPEAARRVTVLASHEEDGHVS